MWEEFYKQDNETVHIKENKLIFQNKDIISMSVFNNATEMMSHALAIEAILGLQKEIVENSNNLPLYSDSWKCHYSDAYSTVHSNGSKVIIEQTDVITLRIFQDKQLAKFYAEIAASSFGKMNDL